MSLSHFVPAYPSPSPCPQVHSLPMRLYSSPAPTFIRNSRPIHLAKNNSISFLFMAEQYSIVYMCHIFFIHSSVDGHLGCLHVLAIVNSAAMKTVVHDSSWIMVFSGYMPSSGIAGSYGSSIFKSSFFLLWFHDSFSAIFMFLCLDFLYICYRLSVSGYHVIHI